MADDDSGEKSEDPTDRRREKAREQGNIARSTDLNVAAVTLASIGALWFSGNTAAQMLAGTMADGLGGDPWIVPDAALIWRTFQQHALNAGGAVLPVILLIALGAVAVNLAQVGFLWAPDVLLPKFERLSPWQGIQRIVSMQALVKLGNSLGKLTILTVVGVFYFWHKLPAFQGLTHLDGMQILIETGWAWIELGFYLALALLGLAAFDYGFQYWKHEQDLKMTRQEVREEMKDMEGDPHTRMRRREAHRKLTEGRQLQSVKTADVVITNPTHYAVAIKYDPKTMSAPTVVAKGADELALQIRRLANEHGVPIIERKALAQKLYKTVKVGHSVPPDLYDVFVEILAYIYKITGREPPMVA
ncbi:MAG: flagellar biosynthesis protein FlhB [Planctomycetaceae bacterium]|nr:flagellar biosynthesis protein FlhB [Planctomycetaceae bacterium]